MVYGFSLRISGLTLSLSADSPELLDSVAEVVCIPGWVRQPWQPGDIDVRVEHRHEQWTLLCQGQQVGRARTLAELQPCLELHSHHQLAARALEDVYVHAGVVGIGGRALVVPGRSHAGKSTLIMALVQAGATYYSDEFAVIRPDGSLAAFARAVQLRHPEPSRVVLTRVDPPPLPFLQVARIGYDERAGWAVEALSAGGAVMALLDNTVAARRLGARATAALARALWPGTHWQGTRGSADEAARRILTEF